MQVGVSCLSDRLLELRGTLVGASSLLSFRLLVRRRVWHIVVDRQVDTLDINTTTKDVSAHTDTLVEVLESSVSLNTSKESATIGKHMADVELTVLPGACWSAR